MSKNISFFSPNFKSGGYEKVVVNLANAFVAFGYTVCIICGEYKGELCTQINKSIEIVDLHTSFRGMIFGIIRYLRSNKQVDYIYVGFRLYTALFVLCKIITFSRCSIIFSQHGYEKNSKVLNNMFLRLLLRKADYHIAVSEAVAKYEEDSLGIPRFDVVYNPVIDTCMVLEEAVHPWFDQDIPILISCGRLSKIKHQEVAIQIIKEICKEIETRLLIIGDGPERKAYESLVEDLGIEDKVLFLGYIDNPMSYMKKCTCLLQLSEKEGFCNTIVEALYAGIPCLTTDSGGPIEIIQGDKFGINLGSINCDNFIPNAKQKCIDIIKGKIIFRDLKKRALDFSIENASLRLQRIIERKDNDL